MVEPKNDSRLEQMPTRDVGLLFLCFQSHLANRFGFLQEMWANSPDFVSKDTGIDPVLANMASTHVPFNNDGRCSGASRRWRPLTLGDSSR
jgi:hypothetical protein